MLAVVVEKVDEAEMDEMWSFVGHKGQQRWLWHAIDGSVLNVEMATFIPPVQRRIG